MTTETEAHRQRLVAAMTAAAEIIDGGCALLDDEERWTMAERLHRLLRAKTQSDRYGRGVTGEQVAAELRALIAEVEL